VRQGLYKADFHTVHGTGCGVVYVTDGKMRGGNSAFAFIGTYTGEGDSIKVKISTERYNDDPSFKALFGLDRITLTLGGREDGDMAEFEGTALQSAGRCLQGRAEPDQRLAVRLLCLSFSAASECSRQSR
jgi:hypothetical protein